MLHTLSNLIPFLLEQTESEKTISVISMIIMGILLLVLVVDSTAWFRSDFAPRSKKYKVFLFLFFMLALGAAVILFRIYYK